MSNSLARVETGEIAPLRKEQVVAQKRLIQEVMKAVMIDGVHYGVIPGCKQPSLYKAGSEAILATFRIAVEPTVEDLSTPDCFRYRVTTRGILPSGEVVGAGVGECSTDEEKYKWRTAVCEKEFDSTPEDRRRIKYSRPSQYNRTGETKQVRTNPADLANTVLKMAKKRAQVDLTLTATGASDVFAQDLEDLPEEVREELVGDEGNGRTGGGKPGVTEPQSKKDAPVDDGRKVTEGQAKMIFAKCKNKRIEIEVFNAHYGIAEHKDLPFAKMNEAMKLIDNGEIKAPTGTDETINLEKCDNCGEFIDSDNNGHLEGCIKGTA